MQIRCSFKEDCGKIGTKESYCFAVCHASRPPGLRDGAHRLSAAMTA